MVRITQPMYTSIQSIVEKNPDKYESMSQFMRAAAMGLMKFEGVPYGTTAD